MFCASAEGATRRVSSARIPMAVTYDFFAHPIEEWYEFIGLSFSSRVHSLKDWFGSPYLAHT